MAANSRKYMTSNLNPAQTFNSANSTWTPKLRNTKRDFDTNRKENELWLRVMWRLSNSSVPKPLTFLFGAREVTLTTKNWPWWLLAKLQVLKPLKTKNCFCFSTTNEFELRTTKWTCTTLPHSNSFLLASQIQQAPRLLSKNSVWLTKEMKYADCLDWLNKLTFQR